MWERETKKWYGKFSTRNQKNYTFSPPTDAERGSTIIDFELWRETKETMADETKELQRWGLARRPAPKSWWAEWKFQDA